MFTCKECELYFLNRKSTPAKDGKVYLGCLGVFDGTEEPNNCKHFTQMIRPLKDFSVAELTDLLKKNRSFRFEAEGEAYDGFTDESIAKELQSNYGLPTCVQVERSTISKRPMSIAVAPKSDEDFASVIQWISKVEVDHDATIFSVPVEALKCEVSALALDINEEAKDAIRKNLTEHLQNSASDLFWQANKTYKWDNDYLKDLAELVANFDGFIDEFSMYGNNLLYKGKEWNFLEGEWK